MRRMMWSILIGTGCETSNVVVSDKTSEIEVIQDTSEYMLVTGLENIEKIIIVGQQYVSDGEEVNF